MHICFLELIEERKCANNEEIVRERITKLETQWETLTQQSQSKSRYLKESNQLQQYNNNVKELDYWLSEVGLNDVTHLEASIFMCCVLHIQRTYILLYVKKKCYYIYFSDWKPALFRRLRSWSSKHSKLVKETPTCRGWHYSSPSKPISSSITHIAFTRMNYNVLTITKFFLLHY